MNPSLRRIMTPPEEVRAEDPRRESGGVPGQAGRRSRIGAGGRGHAHRGEGREPRFHRQEVPRQRRGHPAGQQAPQQARLPRDEPRDSPGRGGFGPVALRRGGEGQPARADRIYKVRQGRQPRLRLAEDGRPRGPAQGDQPPRSERARPGQRLVLEAAPAPWCARRPPPRAPARRPRPRPPSRELPHQGRATHSGTSPAITASRWTSSAARTASPPATSSSPATRSSSPDLAG